MFTKDPYKVIIEACKSECGECDDMYEDEIEDDIDDEYEDMPEMDDEIVYTAEMVHVFESEVNYEQVCVVEMDMLGKFMESQNIEDIKEAMKIVANENGIDFNSMALLVESQDYADELLTEAKAAKKSGNKKKLGALDKANKLIKDVKTKGIKVVKKKSKSNKKKKKK